MQHASLTIERWSAFSRDQQLLMVANEMNRASKLQSPEHGARLKACYERLLRLTDLTIEARPARGLMRELLRWRDLIAQLYIASQPDARLHRQAFRALLQLTPATAKQIAWLHEAKAGG